VGVDFGGKQPEQGRRSSFLHAFPFHHGKNSYLFFYVNFKPWAFVVLYTKVTKRHKTKNKKVQDKQQPENPREFLFFSKPFYRSLASIKL
jgi:hypothetical protein